MSLLFTTIRRSAAFSSPVIINRVLSVALLPVYTRYLTTSDYGILELLDLTLFVFSSLFGVQVGYAVFYHYSKAEEADRPRIVSTSILGAALIGLTASLLGVANARWISSIVFGSPLYATALRVYFFSIATTLFSDTGFAYLRVTERILEWNQLVLVRSVLAAVLNILFLIVFRMGYFSMLWSSIIASGLIGLWIALKFYRWNPIALSWRVLFGMLKYSSPLGLSGIAMLLVHYGDRLFLKRYVTLSDIGIYGLAYKVGMFSSFIHAPFSNYWSAEMFNVMHGKDSDHVYVRIFTYFVLIMALTTAGIAVFARPLITILAAPVYREAAIYVPWIALAYLFRSVGDHVRSVFMTEARTLLNIKINIVGALICLACYVVLIPRFLVWGAVAATLIAFMVMAGYTFFEAQRVRYFHFEYERVAKIALAGVMVSIPPMIWPEKNIWMQLAVSCVCAAAMPVVLLLLRFMDAGEWDKTRELYGAARLSFARFRANV